MLATSLKDKVILITGANTPLGIGAQTGRAFSRQAARVFFTYLRLSLEPYGIRPEEAREAIEPGLPFYHALRTKSTESRSL